MGTYIVGAIVIGIVVICSIKIARNVKSGNSCGCGCSTGNEKQ